MTPEARAACEHCGREHRGDERYCPNTGKLMASRLLAAGTVLENKYRIERVVGVGGMGAVFEAHHLLLDTRVAIKVILPHSSADEQQLAQRLLREARAAAATGHRNVAAVTDLGHTADGSSFVVMELLEGRTLRQLVEDEGALPARRALAIMDQVLAGLEAVHRKGIIHRDLKPENLMLVLDAAGEETIKILDFGISKTNRPGDNLTREGLVIGTPAFMSPEQIQARPVDSRADLYSAGAILYYLLTGTTPFPADDVPQLLAAALAGSVEPPSRRQPGLTSEIDGLVLTAMRRNAEDRYPDARAFRRALQSCAGGSSGSASGSSLSPPGGQALDAYSTSFDEDALVALDEAQGLTSAESPTKKAGPAHGPATAATAVDASAFRPPEEPVINMQLADELWSASTRSPAPRRAPAAPRPASPPVTSGARPSYQGQALRQASSHRGLWVTLLVVLVAGGALFWQLVLRDGGTAAPEPEPAQVRITFAVSPSSAELRLDGTLLNQRWVLLPKGQREHEVRATAQGHAPQVLKLRPEADQDVQIVLQKTYRPPDPTDSP